eukprot:386738_1
MSNLAKCKGKPGCPPTNTPVIFSIGGESYSNKQWPWLASQSAAESMAAEVAQWDTKYGADGIDLDIETGAGNSQASGDNLVAFAKKLRSLNPNMIITQPVYGFPQVTAENTMVNQGFTKDSKSLGLIDSIGIMEYNGVESLQYVKDYGNATSEWQGFPITVNVPYSDILAGINGNAGSSAIMQMANSIVSQGLGGMMIWLSSVWDATRNQAAFTYGGGAMDATKTNTTTGSAWAQALKYMVPNQSNNTNTTTTTTPSPIPGGCLFHSSDSKHSLNLSQYEGMTLSKVDDVDNSLVYSLSPCDNLLSCNGEKVNSFVFDITSMECVKYLSIWEENHVIPKYDENDKMWEFIYTDGQKCNGLETVMEIFWVCDPNTANKAVVVSAKSLNECSYQMYVNSSSACN